LLLGIACIHCCVHMRTTPNVHSKVARVGNSLTVRIPREIAKATSLRDGSHIVLSVVGPRVVIQSEDEPLTLDSLLVGASRENSGDDIEVERARGHEVW
jgi:antitoxin component of MazEF toxin-antitoxin module